MSTDVLTQARTPTDAAIRAALKAPVQSDSPIYSMTRALLAAYAVDAPRILALAYREAAQECERRAKAILDPLLDGTNVGRLFPDALVSSQQVKVLRECRDTLLALATALEEGTPE